MIINLKTAKMLSITVKRRPLLDCRGSKNRRTTITPMFAVGTFRTCQRRSLMSVIAGKGDSTWKRRYFRFWTQTGHFGPYGIT